MFKRLVSNLPFNPSLIHQIGFYADRLNQEASVRRLGFLFMALAMTVQSFAVIRPPEKSYAIDDSHLMNGLQTKNDILRHYDNPASNVKAIYDHYGVTRQDIANLTDKPNTSIFTGDGNDWWTVGTYSLQLRSDVAQQYKDRERAVEYAPGKFVYERQWRAFDIINKSGQHRKAWKGTVSATGQTFWIVQSCGNLTWVDTFTPPPPPPPPPPPVIGAECSIVGPITVPKDAKYAIIPVRVAVSDGRTIGPGSVSGDGNGGTGLHIGVTYVGANKNWNESDSTKLAAPPLVPPDKQTVYTPLDEHLSGVSYYRFKWSTDNEVYRRYYVTDAHSSAFTVNIAVGLDAVDKRLAIRLLDRDRGQWLRHNSGCEVEIKRETPPPTKTDVCPNLPGNQETIPEGLVKDSKGNCVTPPPNPELEIKKSVNKPGPLKPGDTFNYQIEYRNSKSGSPAAVNTEITDQIDLKNLEIVSPKDIRVAANGYITIPVGSLPYSAEFKLFEITVRVKDPIANGTEICNTGASVFASNATKATSKKVCINVLVPCKYDETINTNDPNCIKPVVKCSLLDIGINLAERKATFRTTVSSSNDRLVKIDSYNYDFGDGSKKIVLSNDFTNEIEHVYEPGPYTASVVVNFTAPTESGQTKQTTACSKEIEFEDEDPLGQQKFVENITRGLKGDDAINTKVRAGEELEYTLQTLNSNNYARTGITISDYIGDLLDYATLDEAALKASGGRFDKENKKVLWENVTIPANSKLETKFKIKMLDPIPSTNRPSDQGANFDCIISNLYGNKVSMEVACPLVKGIESLPNTGPGTSLLIGSIATGFVGYLFARARMLRKELAIIRTDYVSTGGM